MSFSQRHLLAGDPSASRESDPYMRAGYPMVDLKDDQADTATREVPPNYQPIPNNFGVVEDHASRVAPTPKRARYGYLLSSTWFLEIICCLVAIIALIANVVFLWSINQKPITNSFYSKLSPNSLSEVITSVAKLALLVPLASVLGQLKWLWFKEEARPLSDFKLYDEASIGGFPILRFLASGRFIVQAPIAWLAAAIALSSFVTSLMSQLVIQPVVISTESSNGTASVLRATTLSRQGPNGFSTVHGDQIKVQQAYLTAAYLGPNDTLPEVDPICSSGNCEWPNYGSLGICAEVVNISATTNSTLLQRLREYVMDATEITPYSLYFDLPANSSYYPALVLPFQSPSNEFKLSLPETVYSQDVIAYTNSLVNFRSSTSDADELQFIGVSHYYCTQSFSTMVKDGVANTTLLSSNNTILSTKEYPSLNAVWSNDLIGNTTCPSDLSGASIILGGPEGLTEETYSIDWCTGVQMSSLFSLGTEGGILLASDLSTDVVVGQISSAIGLALFGEYNAPRIYPPATQFQNIKLMMENIGQSLTTFLRKESSTILPANSTVNGTVYGSETIVNVRWKYLSLLGAQVIFTIIVLASAMISTSRAHMRVLKRNPLATMCALTPDTKQELGGTTNLDVMNQQSEIVLVRLRSAMVGDRGVPTLEVARCEGD